MRTSDSQAHRSRGLLSPLTLGLILLVAAPTGADGCAFQSQPDVSAYDYYVDWTYCQPDCALDFVVYEESNGIDSLQRGDARIDHTCDGTTPADTPVVLGIA